MKLIPLTQGKFAQVDDSDFEHLIQWKWYAHKKKNGSTWYARRTDHSSGKPKPILMHREILNAPPGFPVDHKDHNGLKNIRSNIRICTNAINSHNRISRGISKYVGVTYNSRPGRNKRYVARIKFNGKKIIIGYYLTEDEAALAYNHKAEELYKEFANLNIIQP